MSARVPSPAAADPVTAFLHETPPFASLPAAVIEQAAQRMQIAYAPHETTVLALDEPVEAVSLIRSGAVELTDARGTLVARLGPHDFFGYPALLTDTPAQRQVTTLEDTLLYLLPPSLFHDLRAAHPTVDRFFAQAHSARLRAALAEREGRRPLAQPVDQLITRPPVTARPSVSIREAAEIMRTAGVSSLLLCDAAGAVQGLLTDRDLRSRVVAAGVAPEAPVRTVMTPRPVTIAAGRYAFEALLTMTRHNIHHLPVLRDDALIGVVTTTDLMRVQSDSPVYLMGDLRAAATVDALAATAQKIPALVVHLVERGTPAADVTRTVSTLTDALTHHLLTMAEERLGPPPVPYAWLALGSQARFEQTAHSDQDHALLLDDAFDAPSHDTYFRSLAAFVRDGLQACGYPLCPGDVMATNERWRQPLAAWKDTFRQWIDAPTPQALMHTSIFFDLRAVAGRTALADTLQAFIHERTAANTIFLASLATNALNHRPPLGFFRQLVLERTGEHKDTLDLKHQGVVPIVDLARIHALAHGLSGPSTDDRLRRLADTHALATDDAADLRDAHAFINRVRLEHQAEQLRTGTAPDNFVDPAALSPLDRRHLKDAFSVVRTLQQGLAQRYQTDLLS
ncbi:putative nucleotidyltransferase substrate binding domain-containing protein [Salisaeta longa]|uniref:putative nucleotidyltransferase substrate binding domain-containing protein n=1 Tax=Salisaeta longa TaxID=503170 RepID=UPI0003B51975|nr:putative nucleotidyltransferase substrate binding domain-containing protein [Salisaeta longa]